MRYTRLEIRRINLSERDKTIFAFFVVIPLMSIFLGWAINKMVITPAYSQKIGKQNAYTSNNINQIQVENKKIYFIQLGVFSSEENAKVMIDTLKKAKVASYYYKDDEIFRVITDLTTNKNYANKRKEELDKNGYNCMVKEFDLKNDKLKNKQYNDLHKLLVYQIDLKDGQTTEEEYKINFKNFYNKYKDDESIIKIMKYVDIYNNGIKNKKQEDIIMSLIKQLDYINNAKI